MQQCKVLTRHYIYHLVDTGVHTVLHIIIIILIHMYPVSIMSNMTPGAEISADIKINKYTIRNRLAMEALFIRAYGATFTICSIIKTGPYA